MKVGAAVIFQNPLNERSDYDVYRNELPLGDLAEPLGFDSLWSVEHHFDDYTMCPDVLQFLSYYSGRTRNIQLGSMVVVLPWHDPIRVAEQVSVLDHYSNGRVILGFGRGLARIEFDGFRIPLGESRERFIEYATMILEGLERGYLEYDGKYVQQPRRDIRPKPFKSFKGRSYAAAVSPESARIMARLGLGILIIPQKPWEAVAQELAEYRTIYKQVNGGEPLPTIAAGWVFCDKNPDRAHDGGQVHRRLLADCAPALRDGRRAFRAGEGLRVLRADGQEHGQRAARGLHRVLPESPGMGHAGAVRREGRRDPPAGQRRPF
ncbi:MAG TPA: LLM class flavin-dependent oxidoreductase, partial [Candidatus Binataceae bacterium]|nr:LLM class flavin-dependent oxidoreductase [Candidatus Binataceae bacterium]